MTRIHHPEQGLCAAARPWALLDGVLRVTCLGVLFFRVFLTEAPPMGSAGLGTDLQDPGLSLALSAVVICVWSLCLVRNGPRMDWTILSGLIALFVGAAVSCALAQDKRLAITSAAVFLAPVLLALALADLLKDDSHRRWVLIVMALAGVGWSIQCIDQALVSDRAQIRQYEQDPNSILKHLGIEPGTLQHFLLEHRLHSKGSRGAFTSRNSAGAFGLLALGAGVALAVEARGRAGRRRIWAIPVLACAVIAAGLALTRSKGAVLGLAAGGLGLWGMVRFGGTLRSHRIIVIACLSGLAIGLACGIAWYGTTRGKLPGGSPMAVRWEYWQGAGHMIAKHPWLGVGPGNFGQAYHLYKPPAAMETVVDPHNWILSMLSQYGPLGLLGFSILVLVPVARVALGSRPPSLTEQVVASGIIAILVACLLDFALSEPGVGTALWAAIGMLYAGQSERVRSFKSHPWSRIGWAAGLVAVLWLYAQYVLWPVTDNTSRLQQAREAARAGRFPEAHALLEQAGASDPISAAPPASDARLYLEEYARTGQGNTGLLHRSLACFDQARGRNPGDFRTEEGTAYAHDLLGDPNRAAEAYHRAISLYPGCERIWLGLAQALDKAGQVSEAASAYRTAIGIEEDYQMRFRSVYPDRPTVSRMGMDKYRLASERLASLEAGQANPTQRPLP